MSTEKNRYTLSVTYRKPERNDSRPWHYSVSRVAEHPRSGREIVTAVESGKAEWKFLALVRAHLAAWKAARDLRREARPYRTEVTR